MANKKITSEEVFDPNLFATVIKAAAALRKVLEENLTSLKDISKTQAFNSGDDIKKYNEVVSQTTTNVKAFEMAQKDADEATEQFNKEVENSIENQKKVKKIIDDVNGSLDANIARQTQNKTLLADIKRRQNLLNKEYQRGQISLSKYNRATTKNNKEIAQLTVANSKLGFAIKAQVKQGQEAETSFNAQAQRLGQLKAAYRNLTEAERENLDVGGKLLKELKKLDKQVKDNDASIGNFQRNVGNYKDGIGQSIESTNLFGISLGQLTTPVGAVTAGLTALAGLYATSTAGSYDLATATNTLSSSFNIAGNKFAKLLGADGKGGGVLSDLATALSIGLFGIENAMSATSVSAAQNALAELEVIEIESDRVAKKQLQDAEKLRQIRDDETLSIDERRAANEKLLTVINKREKEQVEFQEKRLKNLGILLLNDKDNLELQKEVKRVEFEIADKQEENEGFRSEALINRNTLNREEIALAKNKLALEKAAAADAKKVRDSLLQEENVEDDPFTLDFDAEAKALAKADQERAKAKKKADEEAKKAAEKAAQDQIDADLKAADEQRKIAEQLAKDKEALRKEQIGQVENVLGQVGEAQDRAADQEQEKLERKAERTTQNIDVQAQLAAQGLDNTLAESQKKQAEIELEQQELAEKQEKRQKRQVFYESVLAALKDGGNPVEAVGKALAAQAAINLIAGSFYEGTDRVGDDAKANLKGNGKDNTLVALTQEERVIGHKDSLRVRNKLGNISNKDLVDLALNNQGGVSVASLNDQNIVSGLEKVTTAVEGIQFHLNIDPNGNISKEEHRRGLRKVLRAAKRRPRLNG